MNSSHKGSEMRTFRISVLVGMDMVKKQSRYQCFEMPWHSCDIIVIIYCQCGMPFPFVG